MRLGSYPPWEGAILRMEGAANCKVLGHSAAICAKTIEPIEMLFGLWAWMGQRNHVLDGVQILPWEGTILGQKGAYCIV